MIRACENKARDPRVGGRERDVEGVVHGARALGPVCVRVRIYGAEVDHGVGAREDAAVKGLLGVCLHDAIAGRLGALRAVVWMLYSYHFDASFLEVGTELAT